MSTMSTTYLAKPAGLRMTLGVLLCAEDFLGPDQIHNFECHGHPSTPPNVERIRILDLTSASKYHLQTPGTTLRSCGTCTADLDRGDGPSDVDGRGR